MNLLTILRRIAIAAAGVAWFALVFVFGLYLTFPSIALAEFARWKVQSETDQWRLNVTRITPSGFGVRADDVGLFKKDRTRTTPVVEAEYVYLSSGPWSLLNLATGASSRIRGSIVRKGGDLSFSTTIVQTEKGVLVNALSLDADELPLAALPEMSGARLAGLGGIDVHVDLKSAEGLAKSNGKVVINKGEELVIERVDAPGTPLDGLAVGTIAVQEFDLQFDVKNGKGKVAVGQINTDLAHIEVTGDFTLSDVITQSRLRLKLSVTLSDQFDQRLGVAAGLARGAMGETWADGAQHFALSGTIGMPRFRTERERKATPRAPTTSAPVVDEDAAAAPPVVAAPAAMPPTDTTADRAARREQAIADRRARMEERRKQLQAGGMPGLDVVKRPGLTPGGPMDTDLPPGMEEDLPPGVPEEDGGEEY